MTEIPDSWIQSGAFGVLTVLGGLAAVWIRKGAKWVGDKLFSELPGADGEPRGWVPKLVGGHCELMQSMPKCVDELTSETHAQTKVLNEQKEILLKLHEEHNSVNGMPHRMRDLKQKEIDAEILTIDAFESYLNGDTESCKKQLGDARELLIQAKNI